jgi:hypothetical protein
MRPTLALAALALAPLLVGAGPLCDTPADADRCAEWSATTGDIGADEAHDVVVSADGSTAYVVGGTVVEGSHDIAVVAYATAAGTQRWAFSWDAGGTDIGRAAALSPDGDTLVVTGESRSGNADYLTLAVETATGEVLWTRRYDGPDGADDLATAVGIGPDGTRVYVAGYDTHGITPVNAPDYDYAVVAYDIEDGAQRWVRRYDGPAGAWDVVNALAVGGSPGAANRDRVYVTGRSNGASHANDHTDFATLAIDGPTGEVVWTARYDGPSGNRDLAYDIAVTPDGSAVAVTGESVGNNLDYATVVYSALDGHQRWVSRYTGSGFDDRPLGIAATDDAVFVTGFSIDGAVAYLRSAITIGYDLETGTQRWLARRTGPTGEAASSIAVSPDESGVYVSGVSGGWVFAGSVQGTGAAAAYSGMLTAGYDAAEGDELWVARHGGIASVDNGNAIAVTADRVIAVGGGTDLLTVAYRP